MKVLCGKDIKRYFLIAWLMFNSVALWGQNKLNFGLSKAQEAKELPVRKSEKVIPVRKAKLNKNGQLKPLNNGYYRLEEGWELQEVNQQIKSGKSVFDISGKRDDWYNATVPGTVLTTLVAQGVYPDPNYGLNNLDIPDDLSRKDWWYRTSFDMVENVDPAQQISLLFNGINYRADVWLNNEMLGTIKGAFIRGEFDITKVVKTKGNILAVHIYPPNNPGIPHEENRLSFGPNGGALSLDGPTFIASEGWDWVPGIRDRNIGIWQDVLIGIGGHVKIQNPQVITDLPLPDTTQARITIKSEVYNAAKNDVKVRLEAKVDGMEISEIIELKAGERKPIVLSPEKFKQLIWKNPKLWWPNGYGEQNLYNLELRLFEVGNQEKLLSQETVRFGIREMSYDLTVIDNKQQWIRFNYAPLDIKQKGKPLFDFVKRKSLEDKYKYTDLPALREGILMDNFKVLKANDNPFLVIKVNGVPIFCRGGNWGMDDAMKRSDRARIEPYMRLHKEENFNMVRNWTGESTQKDFYDLCDEYGMLVWNDFSISTEFYNLNPLDHSLFLKNAKDIVLRFRNHPSIAIWCPRNEGYAPEGLEEAFQQLIAEEDGSRHYHGNSRSLNMRGSGPWSYMKDPKVYFTEVANGFNSELGTLSVPTYQTLKKFIPKEEQWPIGDTWYYHDLHLESFEWKDYINAINQMGKAPAKDAPEFCRRAQVLNFNSHKFMFESWNNKMWEMASGLLLWMSHPAWPSMIWQTYSYDYETHGSYFGSKKGTEPVHVQWNIHNQQLLVVNTTLKSYDKSKIRFELFNQVGKKLMDHVYPVKIAANQLSRSETVTIPLNIKELVMVRLSCFDQQGNVISTNDYWYEDGEFAAPKGLGDVKSADLKLKKVKSMGHTQKIAVDLRNETKVVAAFVKVNVVDAKTGEIILPAYVSDGYFNLLPNELKTLELSIPQSGSKKLALQVEQLSGKIQVFEL